MFKTYHSLPKTIEAVQFTDKDKDRVFNALTGQYAPSFENDEPTLEVTTAHGDIAIVRLGDWIVKDRDLGTYYPVKPDVFERRYAAHNRDAELKRQVIELLEEHVYGDDGDGNTPEMCNFAELLADCRVQWGGPDRKIVVTTDTHWDCECEHNFIHPKQDARCIKCNTRADEQPDSILEEVRSSYTQKTKEP